MKYTITLKDGTKKDVEARQTFFYMEELAYEFIVHESESFHGLYTITDLKSGKKVSDIKPDVYNLKTFKKAIEYTMNELINIYGSARIRSVLAGA